MAETSQRHHPEQISLNVNYHQNVIQIRYRVQIHQLEYNVNQHYQQLSTHQVEFETNSQHILNPIANTTQPDASGQTVTKSRKFSEIKSK